MVMFEDDTKNFILQKYADSAHAYMRAIPGALDSKASFLFAGLIAVLGYAGPKLNPEIYKGLPSFDLLEKLWPAYTYLMLTFIGIMVCLFCLHASLSGAPKGLVFSFLSFKKFSSGTQMLDVIRQYSPDQIIDASLLHCHELSRICVKKSRYVNIALIMTAAAFVILFAMHVGVFPEAMPKTAPG